MFLALPHNWKLFAALGHYCKMVIAVRSNSHRSHCNDANKLQFVAANVYSNVLP